MSQGLPGEGVVVLQKDRFTILYYSQFDKFSRYFDEEQTQIESGQTSVAGLVHLCTAKK